MKNSKIGSRYAKALFDLALEKDLLAVAYHDMKEISRIYSESRDLRLFLSSPVINVKKKKAVIREIFGEKLHPLVLMFLDILAAKRRETHFGIIADEFIAQYKQHKGIQTATLITAVPASDEIRRKAVELVKQHSKGEVELIEEVSPRIIGGFVLKFGDLQYNASIEHSLQNLRREFEKNIYLRGF